MCGVLGLDTFTSILSIVTHALQFSVIPPHHPHRCSLLLFSLVSESYRAGDGREDLYASKRY